MSNTAAYRTERIFLTGPTVRALAFLARVEGAAMDVEPQPDGADCLAENIIREWLDKQPLLTKRQKAVREAIAHVDAELLRTAQGGQAT